MRSLFAALHVILDFVLCPSPQLQYVPLAAWLCFSFNQASHISLSEDVRVQLYPSF